MATVTAPPTPVFSGTSLMLDSSPTPIQAPTLSSALASTSSAVMTSAAATDSPLAADSGHPKSIAIAISIAILVGVVVVALIMGAFCLTSRRRARRARANPSVLPTFWQKPMPPTSNAHSGAGDATARSTVRRPEKSHAPSSWR